MMAPIKSFFTQGYARGARSTALHSLQWGMGLLLGAISITAWKNIDSWILIALMIFFGILFITYIGSYIFLLFKDRDALRSESYSLSKMAIEHGLIGDNLTGLMEGEKTKGEVLDAKVLNSEEVSE